MLKRVWKYYLFTSRTFPIFLIFWFLEFIGSGRLINIWLIIYSVNFCMIFLLIQVSKTLPILKINLEKDEESLTSLRKSWKFPIDPLFLTVFNYKTYVFEVKYQNKKYQYYILSKREINIKNEKTFKVVEVFDSDDLMGGLLIVKE